MKINIRKDGHIHSPYCPHGTNDDFEEYINAAIKNNMDEISFTDHMPFPCVFYDKKFLDDCALSLEDTEKYFVDIKKLKEKYKNQIKINLGFEVDYVDGHENETKKYLDKYGPLLDDSILSVHFVKYKNTYYAIDGREDFEKLYKILGSLEEVYNIYFDTLLKSVKSNLGKYKPIRIGHPTLIRIFNILYPYDYKNKDKIEEIIKEIKKRDYEIDVNTAGLRKPYCHEIYPSGLFKEFAEKYNVRCIYGSDSHTAKDVCRDFHF